MTVYGTIIAVVLRKLKAFMAEVSLIVNEAKVVERNLVAGAKAEIQFELASVKKRIQSVKAKTKSDIAQLEADVAVKIEKL